MTMIRLAAGPAEDTTVLLASETTKGARRLNHPAQRMVGVDISRGFARQQHETLIFLMRV